MSGSTTRRARRAPAPGGGRCGASFLRRGRSSGMIRADRRGREFVPMIERSGDVAHERGLRAWGRSNPMRGITGEADSLSRGFIAIGGSVDRSAARPSFVAGACVFTRPRLEEVLGDCDAGGRWTWGARALGGPVATGPIGDASTELVGVAGELAAPVSWARNDRRRGLADSISRPVARPHRVKSGRRRSAGLKSL